MQSMCQNPQTVGSCNGTAGELGSLQAKARSSWEFQYDIMMVVVFFLGMALLNYLIAVSGKFHFLWTARNPKAEDDVEVAKEGAHQAAAQDLVADEKDPKDSAAEGSGPPALERFHQSIRENRQNPDLDPFDVLNRMGKLGVAPNIHTYNRLLEACITAKNFEKAKQLFAEMKESSSLVSPDVVTYNIYIKGLVEAADPREPPDPALVDPLLAEMIARDLRPDAVTFNTIIDLCVEGRNLDCAWHYFELMQTQQGLPPDSFTFSTLLKGFKAAEQKPVHFDLFLPKLIDYLTLFALEERVLNAFVDVCGKFVELGALERLRTALRQRPQPLPSTTYCRLLTLYGQQKRADLVAEVWSEVKKLQLTPDAGLYGCVLEAFLRCERADLALELHPELKRAGNAAFSVVVCTALIRACGKSGRLEEAQEVYRRLRTQSGLEANLVAFNAMLDCCAECEQCDAMHAVFADLVSESKRRQPDRALEPDMVTYSILIKGLCRSRRVEKALALYAEIKRKGSPRDEILFNSLLNGVAQLPGSVARAENILEDMRSCQVPLGLYTYSILVKLYAKAQDASRALGMYEDMLRIRLTPGLAVYTCLIQVCFRHKLVARVIAICHDMKQHSIKMDVVAYKIVINGFVYSACLVQACNHLCESITEGTRLSEDIYNLILRNLLTYHNMAYEQKHQYATQICNYATLHKIPVNTQVLQQVLQTYVFQSPFVPYQHYLPSPTSCSAGTQLWSTQTQAGCYPYMGS